MTRTAASERDLPHVMVRDVMAELRVSKPTACRMLGEAIGRKQGARGILRCPRLATCGIYGRGVPGVAREFLYAGLRKHLVEHGEVRRRPQ